METFFYKGNDKPCTLSVTKLKNSVIVNMCLDVNIEEVPVSDEYPDGKHYEYINIYGTLPCLSANTILNDIARLGYFNKLNVDFIKTIGDMCNEDNMLLVLKEAKCLDIDLYDTSDSVNSFSYQGLNTWMDKNTRSYVRQGIEAMIASGEETYPLWLNDMCITLPCHLLVTMLNQLETYAVKCYNITASHKSEVGKLSSIEDVLSYDITTDYPSKLSF